MIDWKGCIVPIGRDDPKELPKQRKKVSRKCSTCSDRKCRMRGTVCDWTHCGEWMPEAVGHGG